MAHSRGSDKENVHLSINIKAHFEQSAFDHVQDREGLQGKWSDVNWIYPNLETISGPSEMYTIQLIRSKLSVKPTPFHDLHKWSQRYTVNQSIFYADSL